jgi:glucose dehydrogenase
MMSMMSKMSMNRIILLGGLSLLVVWLVLEQHYYQNSARVKVNVYLMKNDSLAAAAAAAAAAEQQRSLTNQQQNQQQQQHQQQQQTEQKEQKKHQRHRPIRQISILGERNSGTRWTYE